MTRTFESKEEAQAFAVATRKAEPGKLVSRPARGMNYKWSVEVRDRAVKTASGWRVVGFDAPESWHGSHDGFDPRLDAA